MIRKNRCCNRLRLFKCQAILGFCLLLAGCNPVGPNYHPPKNSVPPQWHNAPRGNERLDTEALASWWHQFNDPHLNSLIRRAMCCNYDLKVATAKIREARALYRVQEANLWPNISAQGFYTREQFSNTALGSFLPGIQGSPPGSTLPRGISFSRAQDLFQATFDATWEIDLFGGVRRSIEAQGALFCKAIEDRRGVLVTLLAEVARNYIELRGYQQEIYVALENAEVQRRTLAISVERYQAGLINYLDVASAQAQLSTTEATIPILEIYVKEAIHRISVLLGQEPGALYCELCQTTTIPCNPPEVPAGIPAQLLCRRPDIKSAEKNLAYACAEIGVAEAQLYPQLTLAGDIGYQSSTLGRLLSGQSAIYSFGPIINIPIFNAGALAANVRANKARFQQALYEYRQIVLLALEDVENAMVAYAQEHNHYYYLYEAYQANRISVDLARSQYERGLVNYLNVLSAEKDLFNSEMDLLLSRVALSIDLVALYKALGGGWECEILTIPLKSTY